MDGSQEDSLRLFGPVKTIGAGAVLAASLVLTSYLRTPELPQIPAPAEPGPRTPAALTKLATDPKNYCDNLYRTICSKRGVTRDPTGVVKPDVDGELRALRTYEMIIHDHPDWTSEQVDEELVRRVYTPERRKRIESAYRWVRQALERFVRSQPARVFNEAEKTVLLERVRRTELQLPPPVAVYADEPDLFTKNDVFYERLSDGRMRMRVGGAYILNAKSWFNLVFTMAHEFAHSIDPCELKSSHVTIPSYQKITSCFLSHGLIAARDNRQECGENDQLSETFADWMAVQVVSDALKSFAGEFQLQQLRNAATNSVRDLCEQEEAGMELDLEFHPSPEIRIDRIFGRNPKIREALGCAPVAREVTAVQGSGYCGFDYAPSQPPASPEHL